jgi:type II secretory pathway component PulM
MKAISVWVSALSARERLLIQVALLLLVGVLAPFLIYRTAEGFAESAHRKLGAAQSLERDAAELERLTLTSASTAPPSTGATPRDIASDMASMSGLVLSHVEPDGPAGVQLGFQPASALAVYRWIDGAERSGLQVTRVVMVRAGDGDLVSAQVRASSRAP